jgi:hypothetical protein
VFPRGGSVDRRPPSLLTGSRGPVCLFSDAPMKTLRLPWSVSRASLRSARDTPSCLARSLPSPAKLVRRCQDLGKPVPSLVWPVGGGDRRPSQGSREPTRTAALLLDPGRSLAPGLVGRWRCCSRRHKGESSSDLNYFEAQSPGFCARCLRLRPPSLTTLQGWLPGGGHLSRVGLGFPTEFLQRISTLISSLFPFFLDFAWRYTPDLDLARAQGRGTHSLCLAAPVC